MADQIINIVRLMLLESYVPKVVNVGLVLIVRTWTHPFPSGAEIAFGSPPLLPSPKYGLQDRLS